MFHGDEDEYEGVRSEGTRREVVLKVFIVVVAKARDMLFATDSFQGGKFKVAENVEDGKVNDWEVRNMADQGRGAGF